MLIGGASKRIWCKIWDSTVD